MPADIQMQIYNLFFHTDPTKCADKMKVLIQEIPVHNEELLMVLAEMCIGNEECYYAEKIIKQLRKLNKTDSSISILEDSFDSLQNNFLDFPSAFADYSEGNVEDYPLWDYPESPEPYRRTEAKIGRNDPCLTTTTLQHFPIKVIFPVAVIIRLLPLLPYTLSDKSKFHISKSYGNLLYTTLLRIAAFQFALKPAYSQLPSLQSPSLPLTQ